MSGRAKYEPEDRPIECVAAEKEGASIADRVAALLAQFDRVPDRADAFDPLEWAVLGLPK